MKIDPVMLTTFQTELAKHWSEADKRARVLAMEPMAEHTTFRVGGPADLFFEPENVSDLADILAVARTVNFPVTILGNGSNVVVADLGIRGLVISLGDAFSDITRAGNLLIAKAGAKLSRIAAVAALEGLGGLAFASGIPGTVGGAVMMNAGAYDRCMAEVVCESRFLDNDLIEAIVTGEAHHFDYRTSCYKGTARIITETTFRLKPQAQTEIYAEMADLAARRRTSQPLEFPSAGSAFKRPAGYYAGKLIADSGMKGYRIGGAEVSEKHAGFIINRGLATASDVALLFYRVREAVKAQFGVQLEPEVRFIGDWDGWQEAEVIPWRF
ncbi:MAG: UDP-N-acetylmuramate dehydrogenase [Eubacteriales bacterium]|nr:UDP-N-acetylmuramate dehydrogenase [Eubacteriales bacterium]